jgi:hypothetical protein
MVIILQCAQINQKYEYTESKYKLVKIWKYIKMQIK